MRIHKGKIAITGAALAACSLALSPALAAVRSVLENSDAAPVSLQMLGSIGSFTPVTNDKRLAKAYAQAARASQSRGFRFTPTSGSISGRSLTILVRAQTGIDVGAAERVLPNLGVAPVAYKLGTTKGLAQFSTGARLDPAIPDPVIEHVVQEPVASYTLQPKKKDRFSANLQLQNRDATAVAPTEDTPATLGVEQTYSVDLSSSYSLTKNLNVQAGVRYKGPSNRLAPVISDQTQDSKAVYVGTTFKF